MELLQNHQLNQENPVEFLKLLKLLKILFLNKKEVQKELEKTSAMQRYYKLIYSYYNYL